MNRPSSPDRNPTACFSVQAEADAQVMPRVLELFAKRGLVPAAWHSVAGPRELHIDIQVSGLPAPLTEAIAEGLRRVVGVETVLTSEKRHAASA